MVLELHTRVTERMKEIHKERKTAKERNSEERKCQKLKPSPSAALQERGFQLLIYIIIHSHLVKLCLLFPVVIFLIKEWKSSPRV